MFCLGGEIEGGGEGGRKEYLRIFGRKKCMPFLIEMKRFERNIFLSKNKVRLIECKTLQKRRLTDTPRGGYRTPRSVPTLRGCRETVSTPPFQHCTPLRCNRLLLRKELCSIKKKKKKVVARIILYLSFTEPPFKNTISPL